MAIHLLPTGDASAGRRFHLFANEFAYAMGSEINFETVQLLTPDVVVMNLVCVDPSLGIIPNRTSHKRSAAEFWTTYNVDYAGFHSRSLKARVEAVRDAFVAAVSQIPKARMQDEVKTALVHAADTAVDKLLREPDRLPR